MIQILKSSGTAKRWKMGLAVALMAMAHVSLHAQQKNSNSVNFDDYMKALGVGDELKGLGNRCSPLANFEVGDSVIWSALNVASLCTSDDESGD